MKKDLLFIIKLLIIILGVIFNLQRISKDAVKYSKRYEKFLYKFKKFDYILKIGFNSSKERICIIIFIEFTILNKSLNRVKRT